MRFRCAALTGEERALRTRFAGDAAALRWLDEAPLAFRMRDRFIARFDGPVPTRIRTIEQSGVDRNGRSYRLAIDSRAGGGRSTRITATYGTAPERQFTLSNRVFPLLDLSTLKVGASEIPGLPSLALELNYGHPRRYCPERNYVSRPWVTIIFEPGRVRGRDTRRNNCQHIYVEITDVAAR